MFRENFPMKYFKNGCLPIPLCCQSKLMKQFVKIHQNVEIRDKFNSIYLVKQARNLFTRHLVHTKTQPKKTLLTKIQPVWSDPERICMPFSNFTTSQLSPSDKKRKFCDNSPLMVI